MVALLEAHLHGDEAAINTLVNLTNKGNLFECTMGFLVAAFGQAQVAAVLTRVTPPPSVELVSLTERHREPDSGINSA